MEAQNGVTPVNARIPEDLLPPPGKDKEGSQTEDKTAGTSIVDL